MSESQTEGTFVYKLLDRDITFLETTPGMMIALRRYVTRLRDEMLKEADEEKVMGGFHKINAAYMDLIDSRFVDPADRDWVEKMMMTGQIKDTDLHPIMSNGAVAPQPPADDADAVPAKKTGRKQPAKKVAKKAARGSVKR